VYLVYFECSFAKLPGMYCDLFVSIDSLAYIDYGLYSGRHNGYENDIHYCKIFGNGRLVLQYTFYPIAALSFLLSLHHRNKYNIRIVYIGGNVCYLWRNILIITFGIPSNLY